MTRIFFVDSHRYDGKRHADERLAVSLNAEGLTPDAKIEKVS